MKFRQVLALSLIFARGAIGLSPALAGGQLAGRGIPIAAQDGVQTQAAGDVSRSGAFHGFDAEHGVVWINDYLYWLHPSFKVIGNSTKLGLLSAIRRGETVEFAAVPDPKDPRRTLVVEIRRK